MKLFTHIGDGIILKSKDIIGIFDMKTINTSRENKRIQFELKEKNLDGKSVILLQDKDKVTNLVSQISVATLKKRIEKGIL